MTGKRHKYDTTAVCKAARLIGVAPSRFPDRFQKWRSHPKPPAHGAVAQLVRPAGNDYLFVYLVSTKNPGEVPAEPRALAGLDADALARRHQYFF